MMHSSLLLMSLGREMEIDVLWTVWRCPIRRHFLSHSSQQMAVACNRDSPSRMSLVMCGKVAYLLAACKLFVGLPPTLVRFYGIHNHTHFYQISTARGYPSAF